MDNAYLGDFFDGIPAILFQTRRHIHDADFEVIQRIHRRLGLLNYLVSPRESRPQSTDYTLYIFVRKIHVLGNNSSSKRNRILSTKNSFSAKNSLQLWDTRASMCYEDFPKIEEIDNFNLYIWHCNIIYIEFQEGYILLIMNHICVIFNPFITHYATYSVVQPIFYFCHPWRSIYTAARLCAVFTRGQVSVCSWIKRKR